MATKKGIEIEEGFSQLTINEIVHNVQLHNIGNGTYMEPFIDTLISMNQAKGIPAEKVAKKYSREEEAQRKKQELPQEYFLYIGQSNASPGRVLLSTDGGKKLQELTDVEVGKKLLKQAEEKFEREETRLENIIKKEQDKNKRLEDANEVLIVEARDNKKALESVLKELETGKKVVVKKEVKKKKKGKK